MSRSLLLSSEYSQLLKNIQNRMILVNILWGFFLSVVPHHFYYILPLQSIAIFSQNQCISKWQESSLQGNGNDGAKHVLVSGSISSIYTS